jgi:hypothetical protein
MTAEPDSPPSKPDGSRDVTAPEEDGQVLSVEEKACRCDACGTSFAVIYSRMKPVDGFNDTVVQSVLLPCPKPGCNHRSRYFVPMNARGVMIREWWGSTDVSPRPSLDEIVRRSDAVAAAGSPHATGAPSSESAGAAQQGDEADER